MASESLLVSEVVPAAPDEIFSAWLDTNTHSAFTGETANIEPFVGGSHSAFNGYATGRFVRLEKDHLIAATWRSTEFPDDAADSHIEVTLEETVGGTTLTLLHTDIPDGLAEQCRDAWIKYYLVPLRQHFATRADADGVDDEVRVVVTTEDPEDATDALDDGVSDAGKATPRAGGRGSARGRNGVASHAESAGMDAESDDEEDDEDNGDESDENARTARKGDEATTKTAAPKGGGSSQSAAKTKGVAPTSKAVPSSKAAAPAKTQSKAAAPAKTTSKTAPAARTTSKAAAPAKTTSKAAPAARTTSKTSKVATSPKTKAAGPGAKKGRLAPTSKKSAGRKTVSASSGARTKRPAQTTKAKAAKGRTAMAASSKATRKPATQLAAKKKNAASKPSPKAVRGKKTAKGGARQRR